MSEKDLYLDRQLIERLGELPPPEAEIERANPWTKPIGFITWGFILTTLHLDFLYLQYILPTLGVILLFLGFRSLRNENNYFKTVWIFSIFKLIWQLADLVRLATPLSTYDFPLLAVGTVMLAFQIVMFLLFRAALLKTAQKAGKGIDGSPLIWASVWTIAAFLIALSPLAHSWLAFIPMLICYILIVRSLYRIGGRLDDAGYALTNSAVWISNRTFGWAYFLLALFTVLFLSAYSNHLQLEGQPYRQPALTEVRQQLLDMDFPAEALQYLGDQELELLSGAVNVEAFSKLLMIDPKRVEHRDDSQGYTYVTHRYEPGKKNVEALTVYIQMPDRVIYVLQYFSWQGGRPVWQDGISIAGDSDDRDKEIIKSGLFYSKKGIRYTAPFPRLTCEKITLSNMFGSHEHVMIRGAFSYPFGSTDQGGYVLYRYTVPVDSDSFITHAFFSYLHDRAPFHIPYTRAEDRIMTHSFDDNLQQHITTYESLEFKERNQ